MAAGDYDRPILIQARHDGVQDSFGQPIPGWSTIATCFAKFESQAGGEVFIDDVSQRRAKQVGTFKVRYREGIEPRMRIQHRGEYWEIVDVAEDETGRNRDLKLTAYTFENESGS